MREPEIKCIEKKKKVELFEKITWLVKEELGISELVKTETQKLIDKIVADSNRWQKKENARVPSCGLTMSFQTLSGKFKTLLFGKAIDVIYQIKVVSNENELKSLKISNAGSFSADNSVLKTTIVYMADKQQYFDFNGTTEHEVKHIFQFINSGKKFLAKNKTRSMYKTALMLTDMHDYYEQVVGWTIYYACKFERDAFVSGLYRKVIDNWSETPIDVIKQTNLYKNLKIISDEVERESTTSVQRIEDVCEKYFGKHYKWWKNIAKQTVSGYLTKIGKVLAKIEKDRDGELTTPDKKITEYPKFNKENEDES